MIDLSPDSFPGFRPLLQRLAELWEPPSTTTTPYTTATPAPSDVAAAAILRRHAAGLLDLAVQLERAPELAASATAGTTRKRSPKHPVPIDAAAVEQRWELWSRCLTLSMMHGHGKGKLSQRYFAAQHNLNASEFSRWLSSKGRRGIPPGSVPDANIKRALQETIVELENAAVTNTHGASKIPNPAAPFGPTMGP